MHPSLSVRALVSLGTANLSRIRKGERCNVGFPIATSKIVVPRNRPKSIPGAATDKVSNEGALIVKIAFQQENSRSSFFIFRNEYPGLDVPLLLRPLFPSAEVESLPGRFSFHNIRGSAKDDLLICRDSPLDD